MSYQLGNKKNNLKDKLITVGVISSAHGINGQIVVKSFTDPANNILNLPIFDQKRNAIILKMLKTQANGNFVCNLKDCCNRTEAEKLVKKTLYCLRSNLPKISSENEFYIEDLKGMKVINLNKVHIGNIANIANYGGGDIIEIEFNDQKKEMLPFTKELFPEITKNYVVLKQAF